MTSCLISSTIVELLVDGAIEALDDPKFLGVPTALEPNGPAEGFSLIGTGSGAGASAFLFLK